jgi:hypothetical protein
MWGEIHRLAKTTSCFTRCLGTCYNDIQTNQSGQVSDKLNIANEMRQLDRKNRNFYRELTDEERKKFSNYLMIRWASHV